MRVQLVVQVYLKDRPKGYLGKTGESYNIGKDRALTMEQAICGLIHKLGSYYGMCYTADELNEQMDKIALWCQRVRFVNERSKDGGPDHGDTGRIRQLLT